MFWTKKDAEIDRVKSSNVELEFWNGTYIEAIKNRTHENRELKKMVVKWREAYYKELRKRIEIERKYKALRGVKK